MNTRRPEPGQCICFDDFELHPQRGELRRSGALIRLQPQPLQVLTLLASHPGEVVTREQIQQQLWKEDTFVDFEQGLNFCIRRIRSALGDDAESPKYIQTIPRRGYRFIASVDQPHSTSVRLAVLPLESFSSDPEQEYFSDGLTEELINDLAQISALGVISRTSVMRYKETSKSLSEIADELHVSHVIEGSVRRSGHRVRIVVQLIHAANDRHVWAQTYERDLGDILGLQSELARSIAAAVEVKLTPSEQVRSGRTRPVRPEAHDLALKGRHHFNRGSVWDMEQALALFEAATEMDPQYAMAYAWLANTYCTLCVYGARDPREIFAEARCAADRALEIDPMLAEAHAVSGRISMEYEHDWPSAEAFLHKALQLNPGSAECHHGYSIFLMLTGRHNAAEKEIEYARHLDPFSVAINGLSGMNLYFMRRYDEAGEQLRYTLAIDRHFPPVQYRLGLLYAVLGEHRKALFRLKLLRMFSNGHPRILAAIGYVHALAGRSSQAHGILMKLASLKQKRYVSPIDFALVATGLRDHDAAFSALNEAFAIRDPYLPLAVIDPTLDDLRADPRFEELLTRMHFPATQPAMTAPEGPN